MNVFFYGDLNQILLNGKNLTPQIIHTLRKAQNNKNKESLLSLQSRITAQSIIFPKQEKFQIYRFNGFDMHEKC